MAVQFPTNLGFSPSLRSDLMAALERARREPRSDPPIAAFDADGTLWKRDVSDDLLDWVGERALVPVPERWPSEPASGKRTLRGYCDVLCERSRPEGYAWAAAVYAGRPEAEVAEWARASWAARGAASVNPEMAGLVRWLTAEGVLVYIVSASPVWAVVPGAEALGLPADRVLAIDVDREDGRHTDRVHAPITAGAGKVERFQRDIGRSPFLAAGNTIDDLALIDSATEFGFIVDPRRPHGSGVDLAALAVARRLPIHLTA